MKKECFFCEHHCLIEEGARGFCGVRENKSGNIETLNYGYLTSVAIDPIEKKPFYHVNPGSKTLSIAMFGCNFTCKFCQNFTISQKEFLNSAESKYFAPEEISELMIKNHLKSVSYTYSEPTVWQDFMLECAKHVKKAGGKNYMITNGYFSEKALLNILPLIDGFNIDLKGSDDFYKKYTGGRFAPVLRNIQRICNESNKIIEVTTLVIETIHSFEEILEIGKNLSKAGVKVWHLSRFYPCWKMKNIPQTTEKYMDNLITEIKSKTNIPFIYSGNCSKKDYQQTHCIKCGNKIISRNGYFSDSDILKNGYCPYCNTQLYGLFSE